MEKKCVKCARLSAEHFTYCRYCGATLPVVDRDPRFIVEDDASYSEGEDCTAISPKDYEYYIGPNSDKISEVFDSISDTGSKTSWCTPVFLLGLLFGFYGISAWFFSRKLNRLAFCFLFAGIFLTVTDTVINRQLNAELFSLFGSFFSGNGSTLRDVYSVATLFSGISEYFYLKFSVSSFFGTVFSFIASFFALGSYKTKADRDILRIKTAHTEEDSLSLGVKLRRAGGRKILRATVPFAVGAVANILSFAGTVLI